MFLCVWVFRVCYKQQTTTPPVLAARGIPSFTALATPLVVLPCGLSPEPVQVLSGLCEDHWWSDGL